MRIHIVTQDHTSNQILARLAAVLVDDAAFSVGSTPDPLADVNYFFPYLNMQGFEKWHQTKTAAWFTHLDEGRGGKVAMWQQVAQAVDLRLTCAQQYADQLAEFGKTALVTPPLDHTMFARSNKRPRETERVIGTSGYVYPGGRKGEQLIKRLADDLSDVVFMASGKGWPVQTAEYPWNGMPTFYRTLDVYVCTSTIEGIGYGPLEAMACGIPVVIPRGVGIFDDLPRLENLHRYDAGDYDSLKAAVDLALERLDENGYNPISLNGATKRYTAEAWIDTNLRAFENLLYDVPRYVPNQEWRSRCGVYYVAYGEPARECAVRAIKAFKQHMPGVEVALASDSPLNAGEDIFIQNDDEDIGGRSVKTKIYDLAPQHWEFVIYMDADTELVGPVDFLFQLLADGWSAFFATNPGKYCVGREMVRPDNGPECDLTFKTVGTKEFLQYNGGVFGFARNPNTARFFRSWHEEWQRFGARDQAALDRVFYTHPIRIYTLERTWNCITRYDPAEYGVVLHYPMQARRWKGKVNGRLDSSEAWAMTHPATKQGVK